MTALVIESEWIVPVASPAIQHGCLVVESGIVRFLGDRLPAEFASCRRIQLTGGAILPGLINSHCHLEFSDLDSPIAVPGAPGSMVAWLKSVMAHRQALAQSRYDSSTPNPEEVLQHRCRAVQVGVREAWETGTRWLVDNVTAPWEPNWIEDSLNDLIPSPTQAVGQLFPVSSGGAERPSPLLVRPCIEIVDVTRSRAAETWEFAMALRNRMQQNRKASVLDTLGYAPHAPYTASTEIVGLASQAAAEPGGLVSFHLAESTEEREWTESRTGPFADWLGSRVDAMHRNSIGSTISHLRQLSQAYRAIIAHGNYLNEEEIAFLSDRRSSMGVVYCPRTHHHFRHPPHPAPRLVQAGIPVFLGTDSRASNPDLSIFEEWRTACRAVPSVSPRDWMACCTTQPSNFFPIPGGLGTLKPGVQAWLTWVPFADGTSVQVCSSEIDASENNISKNDIPESEGELWGEMLRSSGAIPLESHPAFADA